MRRPVLLLVLACGSPACSPSGDEETLSQLLTPVDVMPVTEGTALTLPAQRHLVRLQDGAAPARWLLAIQQRGAGGHGLGFFRSDDEAASWRYFAPIQNSSGERFHADLVPVGMDVALVYSFEGPVLTGSVTHDVWFQWWRYRAGTDDWAPSPPVRVFDSVSSSTAWYRAELARDSQGRLWVQAWQLNPNGTSNAFVSVSTDGGASFSAQPALALTAVRGGGRIISLGTRLLFLWDQQNGAGTAQMRVRDDSAPIASWSAQQGAFSSGIYHGAALSAVADGKGGLHLVYKDKSSVLWYRAFDGTRFGPAQLVEDHGNWELQPAITAVGDDLDIFYNRVIAVGTNDEMRVRTLHAGVLGPPRVLDGSASYKAYPGAAERLPPTIPSVPCFVSHSVSHNAWKDGVEDLYLLPTGAAPPSDMGVADLSSRAVDLAAPDLATPVVDLGRPDLASPPPPPAGSAVLTQHNDPARTGAQLDEKILTPSTVATGRFGKLYTRAVDGQIYGQPLFVPGVSIAGAGVRDVVYVATEHDTIYAFDADNPAAGQPLWQVHVGTPLTSQELGCANISPEVGITSTPVIDLSRHTLYVVAKTKVNGLARHELHALDLSSGAELDGGPAIIAGSVAGHGYDNAGGTITFSSHQHLQRPALLLQNGVIYIAFSSHCDYDPYHGWVFAYDAATLARVSVYNDTPDGSRGGIWMSGEGPSGDSNDVYMITGNGTFNPNGRDRGDSFVKLGSNLNPLDWFTPYNQAALAQTDQDLGSGGALLLPGTHLLVGGGKGGTLYLLDRNALGHFRATDNGQIVQSFTGSSGAILNSPVYWNGRLFLSAAFDHIRTFSFNGSTFNPTSTSHSNVTILWSGAALSVSANGAGGGILWAASSLSVSAQDVPVPGVLRAFDATDLSRELWNSKLVPADDLGDYTKFCAPTIANGRVYLPTTSGKGALVVYGPK